jgi:hypothetical protein
VPACRLLARCLAGVGSAVRRPALLTTHKSGRVHTAVVPGGEYRTVVGSPAASANGTVGTAGLADYKSQYSIP